MSEIPQAEPRHPMCAECGRALVLDAAGVPVYECHECQRAWPVAFIEAKPVPAMCAECTCGTEEELNREALIEAKPVSPMHCFHARALNREFHIEYEQCCRCDLTPQQAGTEPCANTRAFTEAKPVPPTPKEPRCRYARAEDTTWPIPDDTEWYLRYSGQHANTPDRFFLASIVAAYDYLTDPNLAFKDAEQTLRRARKARIAASKETP